MGSSQTIAWVPDGIYVSKGVVRASPAGLKMPKHRQWYRDVRRDLGRMQAMGIDAKWFRAFDAQRPDSGNDPGSGESPIGLKNIALAFFMLGSMLVVAAGTFLGELSGGMGRGE